MILWALLSVGLALLLAAAILAVAMIRAERRARRRLYRALGLADEAVEFLMARSADVLTEISLLRMSPTAREAAVPPIEALGDGDHEALARQEPAPRLQPATRPQRTADGRVSAATRRLPYSGRHRRP